MSSKGVNDYIKINNTRFEIQESWLAKNVAQCLVYIAPKICLCEFSCSRLELLKVTWHAFEGWRRERMKNLPNQPLQASIATKKDVKQKTVSAVKTSSKIWLARSRFKKMKNVINKVFFGLEKVVETRVWNKMKH